VDVPGIPVADCEAVAAQQKGLAEVVSSGFDPEAFRSYATSDSFLAALDAQDATELARSLSMSRPTTSGSAPASWSCRRSSTTTSAG
jgi:hypothetical protein